MDAIADAAVAAARQRATLPACFIAHSFGTFCVARIVQLHPEAIHSTVSSLLLLCCSATQQQLRLLCSPPLGLLTVYVARQLCQRLSLASSPVTPALH